MDKLSIKEARELHIQLWDWMSKQPREERFKSAWPGWDKLEPELKQELTSKYCHCFACYVVGMVVNEANCLSCPIGVEICRLYTHWSGDALPKNRCLIIRNAWSEDWDYPE